MTLPKKQFERTLKFGVQIKFHLKYDVLLIKLPIIKFHTL